jgi:hypothetical protein
MYNTIIYTLLFGCSVFFIWIDGPKIVKETYKDKISKFKQLNNVISNQSKNKNKYKIIIQSLIIVFKVLKVSIIQKMYNNVSLLNKNTYIIQYVIAGKLYKNVIIPYRGPCPILQISNENDDDLTDVIMPYSGNCYDFQMLKPSFFSCDKLIFQLNSGDEIIFEKNEIIKLKL